MYYADCLDGQAAADIRKSCLQACQDPGRTVLDKNPLREVIRHSDMAIKFGTVSASEARNQIHARSVLDPSVGRVPFVYAYFTEADIDYFVMEYVHGQKLAAPWDHDTVRAVANIIDSLNRVRGDIPGPVGGGLFNGGLWNEDEPVYSEHICEGISGPVGGDFFKGLRYGLDDRVSVATKAELQAHVNSRLTPIRALRGKFDITNAELCFTHTDVAPRNLMRKGNDIWLLDWDFAGYLPRSAEIAVLRLGFGEGMQDAVCQEQLKDTLLKMRPVTPQERLEIHCWCEFAFNHVKYSFSSAKKRMLAGSTKKLRKRIQTEAEKARLHPDSSWSRMLRLEETDVPV